MTNSVSITAGVDTHKDFHVVAAVDVVGRMLGSETFENTAPGHAKMLSGLASLGSIRVVGIEGTGSYGAGLTRHLRTKGVRVIEVARPNRQRRRRLGKMDTVDAMNAALSVLSGEATVTPKSADGAVECLRMLRIVRRSAQKARCQGINQLRALVDTCPDPFQGKLAQMTMEALVARAATFRARSADEPLVAAKWVMQRLARRIQFLDREIVELEAELQRLVEIAAPDLLGLAGVGVQTASCLLAVAGDNPERLLSEEVPSR